MEAHAVLEFSLPEQEESFRSAVDGWKWKLLAEHLSGFLRSKLKYAELSDDEDSAFTEVREEMFREMEDLNLTLL